LIHSWDYGVELHNLIGKDVEYCIPEIERRVEASGKGLLHRSVLHTSDFNPQFCIDFAKNADHREGSQHFLFVHRKFKVLNRRDPIILKQGFTNPAFNFGNTVFHIFPDQIMKFMVSIFGEINAELGVEI